MEPSTKTIFVISNGDKYYTGTDNWSSEKYASGVLRFNTEEHTQDYIKNNEVKGMPVSITINIPNDEIIS